MEGCSSYEHWYQYFKWEIQEDLLHFVIISVHFFYLLYHLFFFYLLKWMVMWFLLHHVIKWGGFCVGEVFFGFHFFVFYKYFLIRMLMQCNFFLSLKWNMPNEILFSCRSKRNESTMEERNACFETSQAMTPKINEP